jgi:hypothetical protein
MGSGRSSAGARARHSCLRQPTRPASRRPSTGSAPSTRRHKAMAAMPRPDRRLARRRSRQRHLHPRPTGHAAIRRHRSGRPPAAARAACNRHAPSRGSWPACRVPRSALCLVGVGDQNIHARNWPASLLA